MAPDLIGCLFIKRLSNSDCLWGVIVETEAYSQAESACHGYKKKTSSNETLFGEPGRLYIYLTYGTYHCINIVTDKSNWANGVLLRSIAIPEENERIASGPGLLAKKFNLNRSHDNLPINKENGIWIAKRNSNMEMKDIVTTTRIGISKAKDLPWRWYLKSSRSVSRRSKGDRLPPSSQSWQPSPILGL